MARYRPDGAIEFLGRIDQQVKLRGFRVELGEIETLLAQHTAVRECVALVREDMPGDQRLVAYVVPNQEPRIKNQEPGDDSEGGSWFLVLGSGELRKFLTERLPAYMVPSAFVTLSALPLTPSGKIDRRALPAPTWSRPTLAESFVAPRTPTEEAIAAIWCDVLGIEGISVHDNFFALGGHSLLAIRLLARLRAALGIELPVQRFFETPTIGGVAKSIEVTRMAAQGILDPGQVSADDREEGLL